METNCYNIKKLQKYRNKPFIYVRKSENNEQIFKYNDIVQEVTKCIDCFHQIPIENHIGIALDIEEHSAASCILLLGVLNHNCHFYCLDFKAIKDFENYLRLSGVKYVISKEIFSSQLICGENSFEIGIFNENFYITKVKNFVESFANLRLCYTIATSGSTGQPKMVHVPYECIEANIKSLSLLLNIHGNDVIFLGSPPTFDPFVVELFLALQNGAAVLITSREIRLKPQHLFKILFPCDTIFKGITILQTTPSLFRLFGREDIQNTILSSKSSLRCLILGGEEFPCRPELKSWLPLNFPLSEKRIFNIYGITEVSCWSTIHELDLNKDSDYNSMPLGKPLDNYTLLIIVDKDGNVLTNNCAQGELLIGSSIRRCFIPNYDQSPVMLESSDFIHRKTGDIVERDQFGKIFFIGRKNNTIKRLGKRLCLDSLYKKLENLLNIKNESAKVVCLWHQESTKLIFYINSPDATRKLKETLLPLLQVALEKHEQPDEIYYNNEIPLNHHGKIDRRKLMDTVLSIKQNQNKPALEIFKDFLENVMGIRNGNKLKEAYTSDQTNCRKRFKCDLSTSFINAGGTSFQALSLATEIAGTLGNPQEQRQILEMLLDGNKTINDVVEFLSTATNKLDTNYIRCKKPTNLSHSLKQLWRSDFKKCIDASPTIYQEKFIIVGSHSHLLQCLDVNSGHIISRLELPDRIECSVVFALSDLALVGCYDGFLYGFNFHNGSIVFKINVQGMIKAKPLVMKNTIIVGSYAEECNVMAFDIKSLICLWSIKLGSKGIFSSPLKVSEETVLCCGLDGSYALIEVKTGCYKWLQKLESPIFSTPAKIQSSEMFLLIAEVKGQILVCNEDNGEKITAYQAEGNVFSSLTVHQHTPNNTFIIFGCHDKHLYCLNFENSTKLLTLSWKFLSNSAIFSTPILIASHSILTCTTKGLISCLDLETSDIKSCYDLKAEVFSTPCCLSDKYVYVGARDNFLYAFELE